MKSNNPINTIASDALPLVAAAAIILLILAAISVSLDYCLACL